MSHPYGTPNSTNAGLIDLVAEWLLIHCPFSTLTVLTTLVIGSIITVPRPLTIAIVVPLADLLLNLFRMQRRTHHRTPRGPGAARPATA